MRKTHVLTILIFISLFVFTSCGRNVQSSETKNNNKQNNQSEKEELEENGDTQEDNVALTEDELVWFNESFFNNSEEQITNYFLDSEYSDVKDVDLYRLFYDLPHTNPDSLTEDELELLESAGLNTELDIQKVSTGYMNEVLEKYANMNMGETNKVNLDSFVYLEAYDAYYLSRGDYHYENCLMISGYKDNNGITHLKYERSDSFYYEVILMPYEDGYYFVSNKKVMTD